MCNGGVKTGKTSLTVYLAIKKYKQNHRHWWIKTHIFQQKNVEEPLLYSNIPLNMKYVPLTTDIIERKKRMNYKSVVILSESSLVIDSMCYKDDLLNEKVMLFIKLFGHETHGGSMFIETQAINDNHFAIKRCLNKYVWIHSLIKWIPFVLVFRVRELLYSEDMSTNAFNEDIEDTTKILIISKSVWKKFDCYCYSKFTDGLDIEQTEIDNTDGNLKAEEIISFRKYKTLKVKGVDKNENSKKVA